jgi:hypothetical protein
VEAYKVILFHFFWRIKLLIPLPRHVPSFLLNWLLEKDLSYSLSFISKDQLKKKLPPWMPPAHFSASMLSLKHPVFLYSFSFFSTAEEIQLTTLWSYEPQGTIKSITCRWRHQMSIGICLLNCIHVVSEFFVS